MAFSSIQCGKCSAGIHAGLFAPGLPSECPMCGEKMRALFFPAFFKAASDTAVPAAASEGESGCFFHPGKPALHPCDSCGRFLCALCSIDFAGRHLCPACLEAGKTKGKMADLENRRVLYDNIALAVSLAPLTCIGLYFVWLTGPLAVTLSLWFWNRPTSLFRRNKWRFVAAILLGLAELLLFVWGIYYLFFRRVK
jgi:hypothetical protein